MKDRERPIKLLPSDPEFEEYDGLQQEIHIAHNNHMWSGDKPEFTDEIDKACYLSERYSKQFQIAKTVYETKKGK